MGMRESLDRQILESRRQDKKSQGYTKQVMKDAPTVINLMSDALEIMFNWNANDITKDELKEIRTLAEDILSEAMETVRFKASEHNSSNDIEDDED
jgi:hypothetical protein